MYPIDFFWRAAERWPDHVALDCPQEPMTYRVLAQRVAAFAQALVDHDPQAQTRVGICAANSAAHIVALLSVLACGKIWIPLNPKSTRRELRRIIDATEPSILLLDAANGGLVDDAPGHRILLNDGNDASDLPTLDDLVAARHGARPMELSLPPDATQAIKFTGGTTGVPKGVKQTYRAWMANIANQITVWGLTERDRYVMAAPITHGTSTYVLPILAQGGCHVLLDEAGAEEVRAAFRDRAGTICFMPPTLVYMLMALPGASAADFPRLRRLIYGGAPMPVEKIRGAREFFGPVLCTTYGQTEAPQILTAMQPGDFEDPANWGSVGRTTWFSDVRIVDPAGKALPRGQIGEVVARGDLLMSGYWNLPEETAKALKEGWLHTGDRGLIDERGFLYLKDRLKDIVITGGFNVYPTDVESALSEHPAVHECCVFGVPDEKWGEAVHGAVQLRSDHQATEAELIAFVRERLGPVPTPKHIHFYERLPLSSVGKVLKKDVKEGVMARLRAPID